MERAIKVAAAVEAEAAGDAAAAIAVAAAVGAEAAGNAAAAIVVAALAMATVDDQR